MNFPQNSSDLDYKFNSKLTSSQNSNTKDIFINIPSSQITINFSKELNSIEEKKNDSNNNKPKTYISSYENIKKDEDLEEEEEINSEEYVSSTNLEVETNTYINMTNNIKEVEELSHNIKSNDKNNNVKYCEL